ncbi:ABC transporter permease [Luteitalea sp.]|jgi:ABC-type transport system involved in multi-copper enzyme maturation permease subunit|uniref:ABC transporter permease n=1 Tax=Luteitalea sp. TaxID=2004800 RepID=UPI0037C916F4
MMGLTWVVALNTFREAVRDRVFYNLLLFAVLLVGTSLVIGQLVAGQDVKIIKDLGLAASLLFGVGIAIFIGIQLVAREVERRSVHATLSKPLPRPVFLLGKYVGLLLTLAVNITVMTVALYAVLLVYWRLTPAGVQAVWTAPAVDPRLLIALGLIYVELAVVTAIALLFSTYSSALLSATFTSAIWVAGHFVGDLRTLETIGASGPTVWVARAASWVLPNLALFDVKAEVVHGVPVPWGQVIGAVGYGAAYSVAMLAIAVAIFQRRDFK